MFTALYSKLTAVRNRIASGEKGFTLIELLIVVLIIGVLAAIAIPIYINVQQTARDNTAKTTVTDAKTSVVAYYTATGELPVSLEEAGFNPTEDVESGFLYDYIVGTTGTAFCIEASFGGPTFFASDATSTDTGTCAEYTAEED